MMFDLQRVNYKNWSFILAFSLILIPLCVFRFTGLTVSPPGFYKDEAGIAFNGYSILKTGKDEFGVMLPLFFRSFDDWKEPLFIYSQLPALAVFGQDILATRVTSALWGLATVLLFGILIKKVFKRTWLMLVGFLVLGFMPWHFHFSRIGFQLITLPFFFTLYLYLIHKFLDEKKVSWYYWASAVLGILFYTYYAGRFYGLLFLGIQSLVLWKYLRKKVVIRSIILFFLVLLPAIVWNNFYPDTFTSRYNSVALNTRYDSIEKMTEIYVTGYFHHFSPQFLFITGDTNLRHSPQYHYPLLWVTFPLVLGGLLGLIKRRHQPFYQLVLLGLLTYPMASSITTDAPHVHRTVHAISLFGLLMMIGVIQWQEWFITVKRKLGKPYWWPFVLASILGVYVVLSVFEWRMFIRFYYNTYPQNSELWFQVGDIKAIKALTKYPIPHIVSLNVAENRPSTYELVTKMDPLSVQKGHKGVMFQDMKQLKIPGIGYYLLNYEDCITFKDRYPYSHLIEKPYDNFCIYRI